MLGGPLGPGQYMKRWSVDHAQPPFKKVQVRRRKREQRTRWRRAALARETPEHREARLAAKRAAQRARRAALSALQQAEREKASASWQVNSGSQQGSGESGEAG